MSNLKVIFILTKLEMSYIFRYGFRWKSKFIYKEMFKTEVNSRIKRYLEEM